jgi:hypothetical protein
MSRETTQKGISMTEEDVWRRAREREEIAARVANFKATQARFEREREEYFFMTLADACGRATSKASITLRNVCYSDNGGGSAATVKPTVRFEQSAELRKARKRLPGF